MDMVIGSRYGPIEVVVQFPPHTTSQGGWYPEAPPGFLRSPETRL